MKLQFQIAFKYLFSRKSHSIVNLLSIVSTLAIAITVAAMVFILALQGGLIQSINNIYQDFDPHLKITRNNTNSNSTCFTPTEPQLAKLQNISQIESHSYSVVVNALLQYKNQHSVVEIIGVDSNYLKTTNLTNLITHGSGVIKLGDIEQLIVGQGVAYNLGINTAMSRPATIFGINQTAHLPTNLMMAASAAVSHTAFPSSVFTMDKELDEKTVISSIELARKIAMIDSSQVSAINIRLTDADNTRRVQKELQAIFGKDFFVKNGIEQRPLIFKFINIERWINIMLLSIIVLVASLSLVGSTVTMVSEKRSASNLLVNIGMNERQARGIFLYLGAIITCLAIALGLGLGLLLSVAQLHLGFLQMNAASFLFNAYPIAINLSDILIVTVITLGISIGIIGVTIRSIKVI